MLTHSAGRLAGLITIESPEGPNDRGRPASRDDATLERLFRVLAGSADENAELKAAVPPDGGHRGRGVTGLQGRAVCRGPCFALPSLVAADCARLAAELELAARRARRLTAVAQVP